MSWTGWIWTLGVLSLLSLLARPLGRWRRQRLARRFLKKHFPEVLSTPKTHKVYIVSPSTYTPEGELFKDTRIMSAGLAPLLVAALTPPHWEVEICYEIAEEVDLETDADVVAVGNMGHSLWRAKDLMEEFRSRGKHVVVGGTMSSLIPEWVEDHCDTQLVGEVEETWPQFLADWEAGEAKKRYDPSRRHPIQDLPLARYDLLLQRETVDSLYPIQIARGCPFRCQFCSIHAYSQGTYTPRPVEHIVREIEILKEFGIGHFFFLDDNLAGDRDFAHRLFAAVEPLRIRWVSQSTLDILKENLLEEAIASGVFTICFGMESLQQGSLNAVKKGFYRPNKYPEQIRRIRQAGMLQTAEFIIGMDHDTPETLEYLAEFIIEQGIPMVRCYIYAPIPGTPVHAEFLREGRLLSEDYEQIGDARCGFQPKHFTPEELVECFWKLLDTLFTWPNILRRIFAGPIPRLSDLLFVLYNNWKYRTMIRKRRLPGLS
jgi:radical SAM superfamily enzyme YgiQ (UPF0313 family)